MKKLMIVLAVFAFAAGFAYAGPDCAAHSKSGTMPDSKEIGRAHV